LALPRRVQVSVVYLGLKSTLLDPLVREGSRILAKPLATGGFWYAVSLLFTNLIYGILTFVPNGRKTL